MQPESNNNLRALHHHFYKLNKYYVQYSFLALVLFFGILLALNTIQLKSDTSVKVVVTLKVNHADVFQLFYLPVEDTDCSEKNSVQSEVTGGGTSQRIVFEIPDTIPVKLLRLDLGEELKQKHVEIESIVLHYNDRNLGLFNARGDDNYFTGYNLVHTSKKGDYEILSDGHYDPFISTIDIQKEYSTLQTAERKIPYASLIAFILIVTLWIYWLLYAAQSPFITNFYTFASTTFVCILLLPFFNETFAFYEDGNKELRTLAEKPALQNGDLLNYPAKFEKYYNDNFGFRNVLVTWGGKIKYYVFKSSFVPEKASVGKDGWLFLNGFFYWVTQDLTRENLYARETLVTTVTEWERRKAVLSKDSIFYYRSFFPDKHYIYPEYLPFGMKVISKDTLYRCDQALNYLRETKSDLTLIDVRPALFSAKKKVQVYQKFDSHWNNYGAFTAYRVVMQRLAKDIPALKPLQESDFAVSWNQAPVGDLANMLGIKETEILPYFTPLKNSVQTTKLSTEDFPKQTEIYENKGAATSLTILLYRDSFTTHLIPFLNLHFAKVVLLWDTPFSEEMVKRVNPDIVLESFAARYF